jgi:hypothetical protein
VTSSREAIVVAAALLACAAGVVAFVLGVTHGDGRESVFAACFLALVVAAAVGPCSFRLEEGDGWWAGAVRGAAVCAALAVAMAVGCVVVAVFRGGEAWTAILVGLFSGLFAFALGAVAHLLGGGSARLLAAAAGLALLATLLVWDEAFLLEAADRKGSAAFAFAINPAAAASVTIGFDWIHAPQLYTGNETAESLVGVELRGVGAYSWKLAALAAVAVGLGFWRRP